jgi:hypothetical protein
MNLKRWAMVAMGLALLLSGRVGAAEDRERVRLRYNYWVPSLNGRIKISDRDILGTGTKLGTTLDLADDLKLGGPQYLSEPELQIQITRRNNLILSYFAADIRGNNTFSTPTAFNGVLFSPTANFNIELKESRLKIAWAFSPLMSDRGLLSLRIGLQYYWFNLDYSGYETTTGMHIHKSVSQNIPVPFIGLDGQLNLIGGLGLYGSIDGLGLAYGNAQVGMLDLEGGLRWKYRFVYLGVGYRSIQTFLRAPDPNDIMLSTQQQGWLGTLGVQF